MQNGFLKSPAYRRFKRVVIFITGSVVLLVGVALIVLPGPAFIVIPVGLSILAIEFAWARRWKRRAIALWQNRNGTHPDRR